MTVWQKLFSHSRPQTSSSRRRWGARLLLEILEDRCVPATFYVNVNGGSDANPGTINAPFASIEAAVNSPSSTPSASATRSRITTPSSSRPALHQHHAAQRRQHPRLSLRRRRRRSAIDHPGRLQRLLLRGQRHVDPRRRRSGSRHRGRVQRPPVPPLTLSGFTIQNGFAGPQTIMPAA